MKISRNHLILNISLIVIGIIFWLLSGLTADNEEYAKAVETSALGKDILGKDYILSVDPTQNIAAHVAVVPEAYRDYGLNVRPRIMKGDVNNDLLANALKIYGGLPPEEGSTHLRRTNEMISYEIMGYFFSIIATDILSVDEKSKLASRLINDALKRLRESDPASYFDMKETDRMVLPFIINNKLYLYLSNLLVRNSDGLGCKSPLLPNVIFLSENMQILLASYGSARLEDAAQFVKPTLRQLNIIAPKTKEALAKCKL